mmetsp:Transcript_19995/g.27562  ORF Transcript_19995/g.27562 Transcript_19995/m.27562 type:complete len:346 (-) Transcript_19995:337-1374(-)|eukprot:CAMPEP_0170087462 /NCGR_PEP_ID=MMETSP0019_2-20121128/21947_1 /TAXON_ID=98059 /ORGANISM="Dinobryon sp., Strain UTEXLB2267" /LENGTH=345 /DNA_ID=CAMNT_0010305151 /DNA_START=83 /DNA_END=1120 /DNA_ORIENTATION=+
MKIATIVVWNIDFKGLLKRKKIVEAVTPPKIVFEMVKMSVGLFLIKHPINDWNIYGGCVFIMFNISIIRMMRLFLNFIADLAVGVIMVLLSLFVGLLILVEHPFYWMFVCIRYCVCCCMRCCVDNDKVTPEGLDSLEEAAEKEDNGETAVFHQQGSVAPAVPSGTPSVFGGNCIIGSTDDISELTRLLEDSKILSHSNITKDDLNAKMEKIPQRFCFIKCLKASDKDAFINEYITILNSDETQLKYYENGVIKVSTWLEIMRGISLQNHYCVYRDAYWGENTGSKDVSPIKVSYKSMLVELGSEHICTVDLLIANKHISRIYLFRRSNFVNVRQWFWDNIIGSDN